MSDTAWHAVSKGLLKLKKMLAKQATQVKTTSKTSDMIMHWLTSLSFLQESAAEHDIKMVLAHCVEWDLTRKTLSKCFRGNRAKRIEIMTIWKSLMLVLTLLYDAPQNTTN